MEKQKLIRYFLSKCSESARRGIQNTLYTGIHVGTATPRNHTQLVERIVASFYEIRYACVRVWQIK